MGRLRYNALFSLALSLLLRKIQSKTRSEFCHVSPTHTHRAASARRGSPPSRHTALPCIKGIRKPFIRLFVWELALAFFFVGGLNNKAPPSWTHTARSSPQHAALEECGREWSGITRKVVFIFFQIFFPRFHFCKIIPTYGGGGGAKERICHFLSVLFLLWVHVRDGLWCGFSPVAVELRTSF